MSALNISDLISHRKSYAIDLRSLPAASRAKQLSEL